MRNILIVGATRGVGRALAEALCDDFELWTASRAANAPLGTTHIEWDAATGDLPTEALPTRLDGLVYCPGTIRLMPFPQLTDQMFLEDLQINLFGAIRALRSTLSALKSSSDPSVVLFSTVAVTTGMPMHASVSAAKGALEGLTRSIAAEFAPKIRVNAIAPSVTDTPLASGILRNERLRQAAASRHPMERIGQVIDLAGVARFLLSPESSWMTGQIIHVDGGIGTLRRFN
ncbi:MAG: SDR family oxidoreductase [Gammaproteobacteria bacterium]|jgi:NAD(P)-dependent dehydrogenase (short-subunit alcohol dehydrogenase family)|nr:SDR family oxidoreductase [Gammaproteobacteria bacterium]